MKVELVNPEVGIVKVDIKQDKIGSLFLPGESQKEPDTGVVTHGSMDMVGKKVRFREHFGERLVLNNEPHIWFSDLKNSIYFVIEDAN